MAATSIVMERSMMDKDVLDDILGHCAPIGKKNMKWPLTFKIAISNRRIKFTTIEDELLLRMTCEDAGFAATKSYIQALATAALLKASIAAARILISLATPETSMSSTLAVGVVLAQAF